MSIKELEELSNVELRLELASIEYEPAKTWKGRFIKQDMLDAITAILVKRGAF